MSSDLIDYRQELIDAVMDNARDHDESPAYEFLQEITRRLTEAEEFEDFIPAHTEGTGQRQRKVRIDGYELNEVDGSVRILISDFSGSSDVETLTKTRMDALFGQLRAFSEEAISGRYAGSNFDNDETSEIAGWLENYQSTVTRYDLYLLTDCQLSERVSHVKADDINGIPVRFHVWDIGRMYELSQSVIGAEELVIDFTEFDEQGLPCLEANVTDDYQSYLCVMPAEVLTEVFDLYGSKLLEGNVRSFLTTKGKVNRQIQGTIRSAPEKFFVFNNGISATGTAVDTFKSRDGLRVKSVRYLQLVNGGQTTASLSIARRVDKADLSGIFVPMKLTIVNAADGDNMNQMIQDISRSSNSQNKVSDADFFSNHPFHRDFENLSRNNPAPRAESATFATYWYYERARGQYQNATAKLTVTQRKEFQRVNPRPQKITKTDLAKYENTWGQKPHEVSKGAQKNFLTFAKAFDGEYTDTLRAKYNNPIFFNDAIGRAILFKATEALVSAAKDTWYQGDWRAQIVTYTIAKLANMIEEQGKGKSMDFSRIWRDQRLSENLQGQLEDIAKNVAMTITQPTTSGANIGEWCKKAAAWDEVKGISLKLNAGFERELLDSEQADARKKEGKARGKLDVELGDQILVMQLKQKGVWSRLLEWSQKYDEPLYGKELDLIKLVANRNHVPTSAQAKVIVAVLEKQKIAGFKV
jgi:hypothetical protein